MDTIRMTAEARIKFIMSQGSKGKRSNSMSFIKHGFYNVSQSPCPRGI